MKGMVVSGEWWWWRSRNEIWFMPEVQRIANKNLYFTLLLIPQRINRTEVKLPINWCYFAALCHPLECVFHFHRVSCQIFKMDIEGSCFLTPPFLTIDKPLDRSEIIFSHQKSVRKAFFSI